MYILPELDYAYDALSGHISADIMRLHHSKHHQAYIDKLNQAVEPYPDLAAQSLGGILSNLDSMPEGIQTVLRNHGGGHYNHSLFWKFMSPNGGGEPTGATAEAIVTRYGSYQGFVDIFSQAALGVFGSGWVWLLPDMEIITSPNQDNPIMLDKPDPILGLDVWEHAYYLDYKNVRADYIKAWWDIVDWQYIDERHKNNLR